MCNIFLFPTKITYISPVLLNTNFKYLNGKSQDAKKTAKKEPLKQQRKRKKKNEIRKILQKKLILIKRLSSLLTAFFYKIYPE
jgi:hypothetical protein